METVQVRTYEPGATDAHGNPVDAWAPAGDPIEALGIAPRQGEEETGNREAVIVGLTVYLPAGTVVGPRDQMVVRGQDYQVVGEAGDWRNPMTGREWGIQVALERVEG